MTSRSLPPIDALQTWGRLCQRLDSDIPNWQDRVSALGQVTAAERRERGGHWTDAEVLEALVLAILSNSVDWSKIQRIRTDLQHVFRQFDLAAYSLVSDQEVERRIVPWFQARKSGSPTQEVDLKRLVLTTRILKGHSASEGSAESYFTGLVQGCNGSASEAAMELGREGCRWKLPGFGVALAAETLRNLGFDTAKPDRHICRAMGSWGMVEYRNWEDRTDWGMPTPRLSELRQTMHVVEALAKAVGCRPTYFDNVLWLACAKSGLHLTNEVLAELVSWSA